MLYKSYKTIFYLKDRRWFFLLLKDALEEFVIELEIQNYSPRTIKSYRNNNLLLFTFIENECGITEVEKVKPLHIKQYIRFLQHNKRKTSYINGVIKTFRAYFKYAYKEEYIEINPMDKVGWVREQKVIINTFTDLEVEKMMEVYKGLDYLAIRNKCIMGFFFDTGIRCRELCSITNKDIAENTILIKGKGNKQRVVPISPYLKKLIIRYVRCRNQKFRDREIEENTPFFLSYRFRNLTVEGIERIVKICGQRANVRKEIRCSPHTCRHYFAQAQLRNGLDIYSLSRLLGHENIAITKRYLQGLKDIEIIEMGTRTSPLMNLKK